MRCDFLELLVEYAFVRRAVRLDASRLKQAGITSPDSLSAFDWTYNPKFPKTKLATLASERFVQTQRGVLLIGPPPPAVGRSDCAVALAVGAIRVGHRALVRSTFELVADFAEADATGTRRELVQRLTRVDLLNLEDFGMKTLGATAARSCWNSSCGITKPRPP
ncbi:MAG: ATP-binding protein [Candidatus Omnitrophota bacterium]|jgi:DNA replication protein DnaC